MKLVAYHVAIVMLLSVANLVSASETFTYTDGIKIPCGRVEEIRLSTKADFTLEWDVPKFKDEPTLAAGESFIEVIVAVDATKGMHSIGKHDYNLSGLPCLAMGEGDGAYNPMNREYVVSQKQKIKKVKLLFKASKANAPFTLSYNYDEIEGFLPSVTTVQLSLEKAPEKPAELMPKESGRGTPKKKTPRKKKTTTPKKKKQPERRVPKEEW